MHSVIPKPIKTVFLWSLLLFLAACNTASTTPKTNNEDIHYVASVDIDALTTEAELVAQYGGEIVSFVPEAGFAVLGFNKQEGELTTLSTSLNQDTYETPAFSAQAFEGSGHSAWAGGWSAWAGGFSAWAGGQDVIPAPPEQNRHAFEQINLYEAHRISKNFGEGITVAVIDTGIDLNHPALVNNLAPERNWLDLVDGDKYPMDELGGAATGHGTGVAGLILQVAPRATILPIRVLDKDGKGDTDQVVKAIEHAVRKKADVINLSLGATQFTQAVEDVVEWVDSLGIYLTASSGNEFHQTTTHPANRANLFTTTFSVGSVDINNEISGFTSHTMQHYPTAGVLTRSTFLRAVAPGEMLFSAYPDNQYAHFTGTSFASPLYAGAMALAYSEVPRKRDFRFNHTWGEQIIAGLGYDPYVPSAAPNLLDVEAGIRNQVGWTEPEVLNAFAE